LFVNEFGWVRAGVGLSWGCANEIHRLGAYRFLLPA
jgi:hypothetical protein